MIEQPVMHYTNLFGAFVLFSAICWRLKHTDQPSAPVRLPGFGLDLLRPRAWLALWNEIQGMDRAQVTEWARWLVWAICHIGIALCFLIVLLHQWVSPYPLPGWHAVIVKYLIAMLMVMPWRPAQ